MNPIHDMSAPELKPLLSILIPAYRYPEGVIRILSLLQPLPLEDCELIIFDDSPDDKVEAVVGGFIDSGMPATYRHNRPSLGTSANWNALLNEARGKYCWLLHHDEFPLSSKFVDHLMMVLRQNPDVDVLMLDSILIDPDRGRSRRHLPTWLRALVVNRFPQYLFRRNVIGPASALVIRRMLYPRFDLRLRWLIDVDLYVRLLKVAKRFRMCPELKIGSVLGRSDSITASLGSSISQIEREERAYLRGRHHSASLWLGPVPDAPKFDVLIRAFEMVCWTLFRVLTRIMAQCCISPVPHSLVLHALHAQSGSMRLPPVKAGK